MKVILTHEVTGLGAAGDVVDVKPGYARNFLFRRGLATAWSEGRCRSRSTRSPRVARPAP
jgi:large subunit ribosomal protein L9